VIGNAIGNNSYWYKQSIGNNSHWQYKTRSATRSYKQNAIGNAIGNNSYRYHHTRPDGVQAKEEMPGAII
jgi:hypothetical protein